MRPPPANALVNQLVALTLGLLVFTGTLGLGAVWVRQEIFSATNRARALEIQIADVERRIDELDSDVAAALNPGELLRQNEFMHLGLVAPRELQVARVGESPELRLAAKRNREIFSIARGSAPVADPNAVQFRIVTASYP
ncbi:MAG TPA: hypothetical protein VFJ90_03905 [Candidatus Didemnitutus sp.]|nr:hypothetical protein [Candidatus Didemnitutus sp.]